MYAANRKYTLDAHRAPLILERLRRRPQRRKHSMHHRHRILGPALREQRAKFVVERRNLLRCEARADAGARTNPSAPGLVRVDRVEGERFDVPESGDRKIAWPIGVDAASAPKLPLRIMLLDQLLGRLDHIPRQRNPIEMPDHDSPARTKHSPRLGRRTRPIEPMPALTCGDQFEAHRRKPRILRRSFDILDANPSRPIQLRRLLHQRNRTIKPSNLASPKRKPTRNSPRPRPNIKRPHLAANNPHRTQPLKKLVRKTRPMPPVIRRSLPKVRAQIL